MERNLILVRHGKACQLDAFEKDIDRTLTTRGVNDGYLVARDLFNKGYKPDIILSSPATRALHTALIFERVMGTGTEKISIIENLYHGMGSNVIKELFNQPDDVLNIAVFSHNPGITDLAGHLTKGATSFLPTTGVAIIKYHTDSWSAINSSDPDDYFFIKPKELK